MQLDECKYVFTIKWNVPNVIQRMYRMQIYCSDLYQLALCLSLFFFVLYTIFRDAYWRPDLRYSLASTNVHLWSNETFQTWSSACTTWKFIVLNFPNLRFVYLCVAFFIMYYLSWCILAVRSTMQFGKYQCVFAIKWNAPNVIQRMHHMQIYCSSLSQLALCLFYFYLGS